MTRIATIEGDVSNVVTLDRAWMARLARRKNGELLSTQANVQIVLRESPEWRGVIAFDDFSGETMALRRPPSHDESWDSSAYPRPWADGDDGAVIEWLQDRHGVSVSRSSVAEAVDHAGYRNRYNPMRDELERCAQLWLASNRQRRLDTWLVTYTGAADDAYTRIVGAYWLRSAVARAFSPGCAADAMLVLEGEQGAGKSSVARIIGGAWHGDSPVDWTSKELGLQIRTSWIHEIAEQDAFTRVDAARLKRSLTTREDRYRAAYGRRWVTRPRHTVFIGTTNRNDYLHDETGNRRFWPVQTGRIDLAALERDRDLLLGEAVVSWRNGDPYKLDPSTVPAATMAQIADEQSARLERHPWHERIAAYLHDERHAETRAAEGVTMHELYACLGIEVEKQHAGNQRTIAGVLRTEGWERKRRTRDAGGARLWAYYPKTTDQGDPAPAVDQGEGEAAALQLEATDPAPAVDQGEGEAPGPALAPTNAPTNALRETLAAAPRGSDEALKAACKLESLQPTADGFGRVRPPPRGVS